MSRVLPSSSNSFGNRMRLWAREAGLTGCPPHGLRKVCLRRLAEAGCTAPEIMSISGHKSIAEVERYIRSAEQSKMADRANRNLPTQPTILPTGEKGVTYQTSTKAFLLTLE